MGVESGWADAAKEAGFHLDPNKQDKVDNTPEIVRNSAIEQASSEELTGAINNMNAKLKENPENRAEILAAMAQARARLDQLIGENQN